MMHLSANYSKTGQMKIQEMAFVLVAIMIFFGLVALIFFSIRVSNLRESAGELREDEAKQLVRKLASTPEFSFRNCQVCIDFDKVLELKGKKDYQGFWNLDYLAVELVYPDKNGECNKSNYPECRSITIINKTQFGTAPDAFVSLCRWEQEKKGYFKCELGRIYASGKGIE